jgi:tRNA-specific 2-thiouridylase
MSIRGGKIMVALSGGVDSAVSALLLHRAGHDISAMFMKNWEEDDRFGTCPAAEDAADAAAVAGLLNIPFHTRNFSVEYWDGVFEEFLSEYRAGRTPNPDILCNREIKFKTFIEHAEDLGAESIATGHYVRSDCQNGRYRLLRGRDGNKDQSYFLYAVGQEQLEKTVFPVGELDKPAVRELAQSNGIAVFGKKDSTGICFIGEHNFREFLGRYLEPNPGEMRTPEGKLIGAHDGLAFHTLGQRQGLGIGGVAGMSEEPWYVLHKQPNSNTLFVGQGHEHPWLFSRSLGASQLCWVSGQAPGAGEHLTAKVRYRQADQECVITELTRDRMTVRFTQAQRAVTPGQSIVLYRGEECLGGGIIDDMDAPRS